MRCAGSCLPSSVELQLGVVDPRRHQLGVEAFGQRPEDPSDLTLGIGVINVYNRLSIGFRRPPDGGAGA